MDTIITDTNGNTYRKGQYIDKGSFSEVYMLECCVTKNQFAGKFISREKIEKYGNIQKVKDEIEIHKTLQHKNIVQFVTSIEQEKEITIVLEYCSRFSMVNVLCTLKTLSLSEAKYFLIQVLSAVAYLHSHNIVHRDLKLGNLFINKQKEIKVGDFGLAVKIEYDGQKRFSRCGTPNYIAPEVIGGDGHSYEVDVWAIGCILYTMVRGKPPFQGQNRTSTYSNILRCDYQFSSDFDSTAKHFIISSLQPKPKNRPSVSQLINFPFLVSKKISPRPPQFDNGTDEKQSSPPKRRKVIDNNISDGVNKAGSTESQKVYFVRLFKCLVNIKNWAQFEFGERLSKTTPIKPVVWVNSWMEYSKRYGFAYKLSNDICGVIFNDTTRMTRQGEAQRISYTQEDGVVVRLGANLIPDTLKKKFKVLVKCRKYMSAALRNAYQPKQCEDMPTETEPKMTEVFERIGGDDVMIMLLTNGSIQVNFKRDHTKLILCGVTETVTVIENIDRMKSLELSGLQKFGCGKQLMQKLIVAFKYIHEYLWKSLKSFDEVV